MRQGLLVLGLVLMAGQAGAQLNTDFIDRMNEMQREADMQQQQREMEQQQAENERRMWEIEDRQREIERRQQEQEVFDSYR